MAGLYIHVPYCHAKCYYCDFYSKPLENSIDPYFSALATEATLRASEIKEPITTLYIGGGTPSAIPHERLSQLIEKINESLPLDQVKEFTVEVNPEDVSTELLKAFTKLGVNRVSMGIQALDDNLLKAIGRRHTASQALDAAYLLNDNFDNFSLDIMYGLPGQSIESLNNTLDRIIWIDSRHLSAYLLSYEPGTRLYAKLMAGKIAEPDDKTATGMYDLVCSLLEIAGYEHYEISNFAKPGFHSCHNSAYWDSTPYLGLGASAHSFDGETRRFNPPSITGYINALNNNHTTFVIDHETPANKFNDLIITRLRTASGLDIAELNKPGMTEFYKEIAPIIDKKVATNQLVRDGNTVRIPSKLWLTADAIMRDLIVEP